MKRVHILSAVNAANVSKAGGTYTIRDVCGAVDGIVMNSTLYPAEQLAQGAPTLENKPAPAGHPKDSQGRFISAANGEALLTSYVGAVVRNARHAGGRTLCDILVNERQAKAHPDGEKLVERLDAAINGTNAEPIHVSTGLFAEMITANGESGGKPYTRIATGIRYDHLAILLNEKGAGTPDDGVGMFLNAQGAEEQVEQVVLNTDPEDKRAAGLRRWISRLLGNSSGDVSFDAITSMLYAALPKGAWLREVFDRYVIWADEASGKLYRQDYSMASDGSSVAFSGTAVEVLRKVEYDPVTNHREADPVKDTIIAALNAAGISGVAAMTDAQLLDAYNALQAKPLRDQLAAANAKLAEQEIAAANAAKAELETLAAELAANSQGLTADDFRAMGLERCKALKRKATAAPVVVGNAATTQADEFAGYSLNAALEA